jgi:type I restriction enzyme S subunit
MKQGWEIKAFDDCIEKVKVKTKLPSSSYQKEGAFPIVSQEKELISGYWDNEEDVITLSTPATIFGDHTMVVKYIDFDFVVGADGVKILKPKSFLNPKYFYYWVRSADISSRGYARHYRYLREKIVSIPSLAEQKRIVEILDREFERIDTLKANAEKSLQHAKDLLKQSQNTVFNSIETFPLDSIVTIINGYAFKSEDFSKTNPVKAVKITNVGVGVFIETIDTNLPQSLLLDKQDYTVHTGDIVFALTRTIIAAGLKVAIVPESYNCALLNQRVAALRIDDDIQRKYLYNYFQTASVKEYVLKKVNTLMQPNLSIKDLKAMPIPYCNRAEMEQVVARLDKLKENSQALEDNYKKTIALCDDMKQALLRKAFNGEL